MKLEVGKAYVGEDGCFVRITQSIDADVYSDQHGRRYYRDGKPYSGDKHPALWREAWGNSQGQSSDADLKLELGKVYLMRNGTEVKIIDRIGMLFYGTYGENSAKTSLFRVDGRCVVENGSNDAGQVQGGLRDLVEEGSGYLQPSKEEDQHATHPSAGIPHADLIRAVLDGKVVQWRQPDGQWAEPKPQDAIHLMTGHMRDKAWRLKPEPVVRWTTLHRNEQGEVIYACWGHWREREAAVRHVRRSTSEGMECKLVRIEVEDTLEVISARTEAP